MVSRDNLWIMKNNQNNKLMYSVLIPAAWRAWRSGSGRKDDAIGDQHAPRSIARAAVLFDFFRERSGWLCMKQSITQVMIIVFGPVLAGLLAVIPASGAVNVTEHHNHDSRDGLYVDPAFTPAAAANLKRDTNFNGAISGNVYAQPLYIEGGPGGRAMIIAVTESEQRLCARCGQRQRHLATKRRRARAGVHAPVRRH